MAASAAGAWAMRVAPAGVMLRLAAARLNVGLDLAFVLVLGLGVPGTALATVLAQGASAAGLSVCCLKWAPAAAPAAAALPFPAGYRTEIAGYSILTRLQQSVMNFGILMIQGLVNTLRRRRLWRPLPRR